MGTDGNFYHIVSPVVHCKSLKLVSLMMLFLILVIEHAVREGLLLLLSRLYPSSPDSTRAGLLSVSVHQTGMLH